jgi:hypothetical protein
MVGAIDDAVIGNQMEAIDHQNVREIGEGLELNPG